MRREAPPSFSRLRRWSISLNVALSTLAVLAIIVMVNYLAARHFTRFAIAGRAQTEFSPITKRTLESITNDVHVIVYFDKDEPLYDSVWSLLKEYKFANQHILIETVDYLRDPGAAAVIKKQYALGQANKNVIIFDNNGNKRTVNEAELSELDMKGMLSGQSREVKRTHFKGEMLFTSALQGVTMLKPGKAYFLQGNGEHRPDSDEAAVGYSAFVSLLKQNNVLFETLSLSGTRDIPTDCNLLIVAGPTQSLLNEEVEKVQKYLKQGGRLLILFRHASLDRASGTGLEKMLIPWGIAVSRSIVLDQENSVNGPYNILVSDFADHPLTKPLQADARISMFIPRAIDKTSAGTSPADAPQVQPLAWTGPSGRFVTDIRMNARTGAPEFNPQPNDPIGRVPLAVAAEKGAIRGVSADRGSTRIVACGDSLFLSNGTIENVANRDFAAYAINWLLARNELLVGLAPHPIKEYKLSMTESQRTRVSWLLLAGMPGFVLFLGSLVWFRRRK
jgi:gliding motility-associatede transport system auxiliary component